MTMSGPGRSGWVFLINVPVVVVGLFVGVGLIPESRAAERPGLDRAGMDGSTAGLVAVTYGLIEAGQDGWGAPADGRRACAAPGIRRPGTPARQAQRPVAGRPGIVSLLVVHLQGNPGRAG